MGRNQCYKFLRNCVRLDFEPFEELWIQEMCLILHLHIYKSVMTNIFSNMVQCMYLLQYGHKAHSWSYLIKTFEKTKLYSNSIQILFLFYMDKIWMETLIGNESDKINGHLGPSQFCDR